MKSKNVILYVILLLSVLLTSCMSSNNKTMAAPTSQPISAPTSTAMTKIAENSSFEVHYIDVGQADAALVLCNNRSLLIAGGLSGALSVVSVNNGYSPCGNCIR